MSMPTKPLSDADVARMFDENSDPRAMLAFIRLIIPTLEAAEADREAHAEALKAMDDVRSRLFVERVEAVAIARILAHAYTTDNRPPQWMVKAALAYPVQTSKPLELQVEQFQSQVAALTAEIAQPHETKKG